MVVEVETELSPDQQEALSLRYVTGLRLALLSSGNWAVFWGEGELEIMPALDEGWLRTVGTSQQRVVAEMEEGYYRRRAELLAEVSTPSLQASGSPEELGL